MRRRFGPLVCGWVLTLLGGCGDRAHVEPEIQYRTAPVAVSVGCVVDRPVEVVPLNRRVSAEDWAARAPGAKALTVEGQAGDRLNYEDRLAAATVGCRAAPVR